MNLWKAADARFFRCCVAFLHFLTKTHKKQVNRIREAYSLRSVGIADSLSVPAGHLTHSALPRSGALTALRCFTAPFAHYGALRLRGPVFLCRWFSCWRRRMAQCTLCRQLWAQKGVLDPFPLFFINPFYKNIFPLILCFLYTFTGDMHMQVVHVFAARIHAL